MSGKEVGPIMNEVASWTGSVIGIGRVHSPFAQATGTPVQNYAARAHLGGLEGVVSIVEAPVVEAKGGRGTLEISPEWRTALDDVQGCDRIWVLFWVDRAAVAKAKVVPYRDTMERGLFATRAPARPNPIGLSCVKVLGVAGCFVHVSEIDMLDGTPILDIKPYVAESDSFPDAKCAWLQEASVRVGLVHADARFERTAEPS